MDAKTIFQPKIWYIIAGAMALIGGIENNINAESWAESAWGADGVNDQSLALEAVFGLFMAGFGAMGLTCAFALEGKAQAKFALANGAVISLFFVAMFIDLSERAWAILMRIQHLLFVICSTIAETKLIMIILGVFNYMNLGRVTISQQK